MSEIRKRGPGPTADQWAQIRAAWEKGESNRSIATRFPTLRQTIAKRAKAGNWKRTDASTNATHPEGATLQERAEAKVVDLLTRQAVTVLGGDEAVEAAAAEFAFNLTAELTAGLRLAQKGRQFVEKIVDKGIAGTIHLGDKQGDADAANAVLQAIAKAHNLVRDIAGKRAGQPSVGDEGKRLGLRRFVIVTPEELAQESTE